MEVNAPVEYRSLRLKGQMLYVPESDVVIFLCYPSVMNLDDLTRQDNLSLVPFLFLLNSIRSKNKKSLVFQPSHHTS